MTRHPPRTAARPARPLYERGWRSSGPRPPRKNGLATCVGLVLAALSVPIAVRGADADGPTPIAQVLAFLPWFLVPGWLALLYAVLTRRGVLAVWSIAVLMATVGFTLPQGPNAPDGAAERTGKAHFRVLTANLRLGGATGALVKTLRRERPEIVSVQECDSTCAEALRSPSMRKAYPYRHIMEAESAAGSALLSVYPLEDESSLQGQMAMPRAVADIAGTRVAVQVAHPVPPMPEALGAWREELNRLRAYGASRGDTPTVIAGDFNASQDHAAFRAVLETGMNDASRLTGQSRTPTWPDTAALAMGAQIDHVLLSEPMTAVGAEFLELAGSDHLAVLADVKLL